MSLPSVSIITVTYNAHKTISDCIESVAKQSVDVEHIIIDGASTDDTIKVIESFRETLATVISEPDDGIYHAMNKGLQLATGDIVGILNADDFFVTGDTLKRVLAEFTNPNIDACYGNLVYVTQEDRTKEVRFWRSGQFSLSSFYFGWMPPHPTFFVRRSIYEEYGLFNLDLGSAADYEIMLRFLMKYRVRASYIPEVLVKMRVGGESNISLLNRIKANRNDRKAWTVNDLRPFPWTIAMKPLRKVGQWVFRGR